MARSPDATLPRKSPDTALRSWRSNAELRPSYGKMWKSDAEMRPRCEELWRSDGETHPDYAKSWRSDSPERWLVSLYSSKELAESVVDSSTESTMESLLMILPDSVEEQGERPESPSEKGGNSDYVSVEKFQEVLAELDRERRARVAAEKTMSELHDSLKQLKMMDQDATKKRDKIDHLGDDIFREKKEMTKQLEESATESVALRSEAENFSSMANRIDESVEMNQISEKSVMVKRVKVKKKTTEAKEMFDRKNPSNNGMSKFGVRCKDEGDFAVVWFTWRRLVDLDDGLGILSFLVSVCRLMRDGGDFVIIVEKVGCEDEGDFVVVWFAWRRLVDLDDGLRFFRFLVSVCRLMREKMTMEKMSVTGVVPSMVGA
ncbi:hypothetical protein LR48_Vigan07g103300 [Vigna angularis]|uniref:Uncharacterized protein n=1 Tax=Phaseolus angularis TaxID=3914 RepID=A0A0L9UXQ0_PHAAN|nr:hypothetical protein LR48_Vigan07g103300 [Vigna angularis]